MKTAHTDKTKVVAMFLVRDEEWCIGASVMAATEWADAILLWCHNCTDRTEEVARRAAILGHAEFAAVTSNDECWPEMKQRDEMYQYALSMGATHVGLVDGDEVCCREDRGLLRDYITALAPCEVLDVTMVPIVDKPLQRRVDKCVWTQARLSVAVGCSKALTWAARDGYHHHRRVPMNVTKTKWVPSIAVMHLQWLQRERIVAKHVWYRMYEHLIYPGRMTPEALNAKYDAALSREGMKTEQIDGTRWWGPEFSRFVFEPRPRVWQEEEVLKMLKEYGRDRFKGLDLKGY